MSEMEFDSLSRDVLGEVTLERQDGRKALPLLSPSATGQCYRQSAYSYMGVAWTDEVSTDKADMGTLFHAGWSALLAKKYRPEVRRGDVPITIPGFPKAPAGEADDVDFRNKIVTDLKTVSAKTFKWWLEHDVDEHYWDQTELYAYGLHLTHGGDWALCIFAIVRETGQRMEFWRDADPVRGEKLAAEIAERHAALSEAQARMTDPTSSVDAVTLAELFPREGQGPGKFPCGWCNWESMCWPKASPPFTPQAVTLEGDPVLIEAKAAEYMEALATESDAKRRKYAARDFITGYEGDYGGFRLKLQGGGMTDPAPDMDAIETILSELGIEVPMIPAREKSQWQSVRRVPKGRAKKA